jgi:acetyltransferase-like isoleucine patch superfamily enzyme
MHLSSLKITDRISSAVDAYHRSSVATSTGKRIEMLRQIWRSARVRNSLKSCGKNFSVQHPVVFASADRIEIGDDVSIAAFTHIWGGGGLRIGDRTMIASHSAITTVTHDYSKHPMHQTCIMRPVNIGADVWIGAHAVIMPGVTIGAGAVIGAAAVVTRDVPPMAVVMGVPARVVKMREVESSAPQGAV